MQALFSKYLRGDRVLWVVALLLGLISLLAVYSSISSLAVNKRGGSTMYYLVKHGLMLGTGGVIMYYAHKLRFQYYSKLAQLLIWVTAGLLLLTLLLGANLNSASRWLTIPVINQNFQTSDLAKVVLILYLARVLSRGEAIRENFQLFLLNVGVPIGVICGLILPANFSTAALLFLICMTLIFIAKVPLKHIAGLIMIGVMALVVLVSANKLSDGKLLPRLTTWEARLERHTAENVDRDANYQVEHAKIAIASGGLIPNGPGSGTSRNYLPHPYSDMIYAFIIEEYGSIVGGVGLLMLYLILLFRAVRIAARCDKMFGALAAIGLSLSLVLQALINMAVAVNLVPVTGQPLPLVSMGGTSIWFTCLAIGIVLSVSRSLYGADKEGKKEVRQRTTVALG